MLTPHPGEAARLLNITTAEVQRDRVSAALTIAKLADAIVVLKGAGTVIATPPSAKNAGHYFINTTLRPRFPLCCASSWWQGSKLCTRSKVQSFAPTSSWLWHIAPQGVEEKEHGVMHQIEAYNFVLRELETNKAIPDSICTVT